MIVARDRYSSNVTQNPHANREASLKTWKATEETDCLVADPWRTQTNSGPRPLAFFYRCLNSHLCGSMLAEAHCIPTYERTPGSEKQRLDSDGTETRMPGPRFKCIGSSHFLPSCKSLCFPFTISCHSDVFFLESTRTYFSWSPLGRVFPRVQEDADRWSPRKASAPCCATPLN